VVFSPTSVSIVTLQSVSGPCDYICMFCAAQELHLRWCMTQFSL